jgi:hypothetical protein
MFDLETAFSYMFQFLEKKCGDAFPHSLAGDVTFETHAWGHACLSAVCSTTFCQHVGPHAPCMHLLYLSSELNGNAMPSQNNTTGPCPTIII